MTRDFRSELAEEHFWDQEVQEIFEARGEALVDRALQNREEVVGLCEFIEANHVRSYLEIGIWTGRLLCLLHRLFDFERVAACDQGWAERCGFRIHLPPDVTFFHGSSGSRDYLRWRATLGPVDLVLIDGDHAYPAVRRDFEINRTFPHRFLAFHDITGFHRPTRGVRQLWEEIRCGREHEIVRPHAEIGLDRSTMGIGIRWEEGEDPRGAGP